MVSRKNPVIPRRQVARKTVIQPAFNASLEFLVEYSIGVFGKTVTDKLVADIDLMKNKTPAEKITKINS